MLNLQEVQLEAVGVVLVDETVVVLAEMETGEVAPMEAVVEDLLKSKFRVFKSFYCFKKVMMSLFLLPSFGA